MESVLLYIIMVEFAVYYEVCCLYGFYVYHIFSYSFGSICINVYMVVCFVRFCLILKIVYFYCYVCAVLCTLFHYAVLSIVLCKCVPTTATECQPNCS